MSGVTGCAEERRLWNLYRLLVRHSAEAAIACDRKRVAHVRSCATCSAGVGNVVSK